MSLVVSRLVRSSAWKSDSSAPRICCARTVRLAWPRSARPFAQLLNGSVGFWVWRPADVRNRRDSHVEEGAGFCHTSPASGRATQPQRRTGARAASPPGEVPRASETAPRRWLGTSSRARSQRAARLMSSASSDMNFPALVDGKSMFNSEHSEGLPNGEEATLVQAATTMAPNPSHRITRHMAASNTVQWTRSSKCPRCPHRVGHAGHLAETHTLHISLCGAEKNRRGQKSDII